MDIPTIPTMPAGYIVQAADMNDLAAAATFLMSPPVCRVHDAAGAQAIITSAASISFNTVDFDNDSLYSSSSPTLLTIQTPGFYKAEYMINMYNGSTSPPNCNSYILYTTGSNNPAGSGSTSKCWSGYACGGDTNTGEVAVRSSGIIPFYCYEGDSVQVQVVASATGLSTYSTTQNANAYDSYFSVELVSI